MTVTNRFLRALLDVFFPRALYCAICGEEVQKAARCVCDTCRAKLPLHPPALKNIEHIDTLHAAFFYKDPIRSSIHRFKYDNRRYLARFFALEIAQLPLEGDVLVPVPLHKNREKMRGFSQTVELCCEISRITGKPWENCMKRIKDTQSQATLNAMQRRVNLEGAFVAGSAVKGRRIILVDDVSTTGATLRNCAAAAKAAGAKSVSALVVAR